MYTKIYPSGSNPGTFYGTTKVHKVKPEEQDKIEKFPLRPIISNIGTATHKIAQYICNLLPPLSKSKYTVLNTKDFVDNIKTTKAPIEYVAISFDVVSLFTNVPLQLTSSSKRFMTNNSSKQKSQEKTWKNCSSCAHYDFSENNTLTALVIRMFRLFVIQLRQL